MSAPERLVNKAQAYETLAASHEERAPVLGKDHAVVATGFIVAAIVLREVAAALEEEGRDRG